MRNSRSKSQLLSSNLSIGAPYRRIIVSYATNNVWDVTFSLLYVFLSSMMAIFMTLFMLLECFVREIAKWYRGDGTIWFPPVAW